MKEGWVNHGRAYTVAGSRRKIWASPLDALSVQRILIGQQTRDHNIHQDSIVCVEAFLALKIHRVNTTHLKGLDCAAYLLYPGFV